MIPTKKSAVKTPEESRSRIWGALGLVVAGCAAVLVWWTSGSEGLASRQKSVTSRQAVPGNAASSSSSSATGSQTSPGGSDKPVASLNPRSVTPDSPAATRAANRDRHADTVVTASGVRKIVVDPLAAWKDQPAWPEGPQLFAEVETTGKRYVNLRPNEIGLLPRLNVAAGERLKITLALPESEAGDSIYLEIPNGGGFPDDASRGKILKVGENHSVAFDYQADPSRGNCTVHIRQAGHTRTLPLWVGEPPVVANDDTAAN